MPGKIGPIAVFGVIAAGGGAILGGLLGGGEGGEGGVLGGAAEVQVKEAEIAEHAVMSPGGKTIRIVDTIASSKEAVVSDTPVGRAVIVDRIDEKALCHVLIEAELKDQDQANTPEFDQYYIHARPVLLDNSCSGKNCIFAVMGNGEFCKLLADSRYYRASSMEEILALPDETKKRMLVTHGNCKGEFGGSDYICNVKIDDPRAIAGKPWWVPHSWAGRDGDFNFEQAKDNKAVDRYKTDESGEVIEVNPDGKDGESKPIEAEPIEEPTEPVNP